MSTCIYVLHPYIFQVVQLRPGGTLGTQLWPLSVDLHKTVASLVGRLCATLVAGVPVSTTSSEMSLFSLPKERFCSRKTRPIIYFLCPIPLTCHCWRVDKLQGNG